MKKLVQVMFMAMALAGFANEVPVIMQSGIDGSKLNEREVQTGTTLLTVSAPSVSGYIFIGWSSSDESGFTCRDRLGRALEVAKKVVYGETLLTANYVAADVDSDSDGVADGYELYWYGALTYDSESDTDGDGYTFAQELAAGTNPLMADRSPDGGIFWDDGEMVRYNPLGLAYYVIRSEPEGKLIQTITNYVKTGTSVTTTSLSTDSGFAYWTIDGVRVADRHGRAKDRVTFTMGEDPVEVVAVYEADAGLRQQLYWYGKAIDPESDTDGDGYTFAQEIAAGTDPLMADRSPDGGIFWDDGELLRYNPLGLAYYVIRSDPEGTLIETITNYVKMGMSVTTTSLSTDSGFAYWTIDGVRVADRHGRAKDRVTFTMGEDPVEVVAVYEADAELRQQLYWYGKAIDPESDTDCDGYTFAQELAAGTNPLMADRSPDGGIFWDDGEMVNVNFQLYEQLQGALVNDEYVELFYSPYGRNAATSRTFGKAKGEGEVEGSQIWPVVADVNGDGLWDLIVVGETETNVFVNVGTKGNPEFEARAGAPLPHGVDLLMNSTAKLAGMEMDVEPIGALSATTNGTTMLVSDVDGRIWYYVSDNQTIKQSKQSNNNFVLQHKVWGGSFGGFARGLMLAAVDWEDDGDLDCLCGTAEGKLMLLRDPKVGRPTSLKAAAGVDNVKLDWDPNAQSRVRGYRVYRAEGSNDELGIANDEWRNLANPSLPTYRDYPEVIRDYGYKVSSVSRFYTAGNSTPTETESVATEPVWVELGKVEFRWSDAAGFVGDELAVDLGVNNSLNLSGKGMAISVGYDGKVLKPLRVEASGLTSGLTFTQSAADGVWTVNATDGEVEAGGGTFFRFVFEGLKAAATSEVSLATASLRSVGGATVPAVIPTDNALVEVVEPKDDPTVVVPYSRGDLNGDGRLTKEDKQLMAKLMNGHGKKVTKDQLRAGDYNGNGRLDNDDYQLMKDDFKKKGVK